IFEQYSLAPDPAAWGSDLNNQDPDDFLHNPDPKRDMRVDMGGTICTLRGLENLGCLIFMLSAMITLL
ncbi:hypothetical protein K523DRAFT_208571, partial [Schizophyllum commune Tattone D]